MSIIVELRHLRHHSDSHPPRAVRDLKARQYRRYYWKRNAYVSTATLSWSLPTTRTDGSALNANEIASFDIFDSSSPTPAVAIGNAPGPATGFTTPVLSVGNHGFTVVLNDTTGHTSAPSNVAAITVAPTLAAPSAVSNLAASLNP